MFRSILRYFVLPAWRPVSGVRSLLADERGLARALLLYLVLCLLYTATIFLGYLRGFGAPTVPFLSIDPERYYLWEAFFASSVYFVVAIAFAGTAHLVSRAFGGAGSFEEILAAYAVSTVLPTIITMWLPETVFFASTLGPFADGVDPGVVVRVNGIRTVPPPWPPWLDLTRMLVGTVLWPLAISAVAIRDSHKISVVASTIAAVVAMLPVFGLVIVFIR